MTDPDAVPGIDDALAMADEFDALMQQANMEREVMHGLPDGFLRDFNPQSVRAFADSYLAGQVFPEDRMFDAVTRAIDVKLQSYICMQPLGTMNSIYFDKVIANPDAAELVSLKLAVLSLNQDVIIKSRILWERIMGWVYLTETGRPDIPTSRRRSTKATFFAMCEETPRWYWLTAYKDRISQHDDLFRGPEVHKRSTLRADLMAGDDPTGITSTIISFLNLAMNQVWVNVTSIVGGGGVVALGNAHMDSPRVGAGENVFAVWGWQPEARRRTSPRPDGTQA